MTSSNSSNTASNHAIMNRRNSTPLGLLLPQLSNRSHLNINLMQQQYMSIGSALSSLSPYVCGTISRARTESSNPVSEIVPNRRMTSNKSSRKASSASLSSAVVQNNLSQERMKVDRQNALTPLVLTPLTSCKNRQQKQQSGQRVEQVSIDALVKRVQSTTGKLLRKQPNYFFKDIQLPNQSVDEMKENEMNSSESSTPRLRRQVIRLKTNGNSQKHQRELSNEIEEMQRSKSKQKEEAVMRQLDSMDVEQHEWDSIVCSNLNAQRIRPKPLPEIGIFGRNIVKRIHNLYIQEKEQRKQVEEMKSIDDGRRMNEVFLTGSKGQEEQDESKKVKLIAYRLLDSTRSKSAVRSQFESTTVEKLESIIERRRKSNDVKQIVVNQQLQQSPKQAAAATAVVVVASVYGNHSQSSEQQSQQQSSPSQRVSLRQLGVEMRSIHSGGGAYGSIVRSLHRRQLEKNNTGMLKVKQKTSE